MIDNKVRLSWKDQLLMQFSAVVTMVGLWTFHAILEALAR